MTKPIISFVILILSIGFAFFYVVPAYNLNKERRGDILSLSKILSASGEIETLIGKTKDNLSRIEPAPLSRFEVFLPEIIDPIRFANNIQYIGRKNKIILSDIKVEGPANGISNNGASTGASKGLLNKVSLGGQINQAEGAYTMNKTTEGGAVVSSNKFAVTKASFTFTATYEAFQLLLDDLEKSLGVIDLTSLSFTQAPEDASTKKLKTPPPPTYQYTMAIETYSLK